MRSGVKFLTFFLGAFILLLLLLVGQPGDGQDTDSPVEIPVFKQPGRFQDPDERIADLEMDVAQNLSDGFALAFDHYPTAEEVQLFLEQLEVVFPDLVEVEEIGRSAQDRPIMGIRISTEDFGDPETKPAYYMDGQHHGNEAVSGQVVLYTLWYLLTQYDHDPFITHLLNTRTVYAVPLVNPDANNIFLQIDQNQRKSANPTDEDGDGSLDEDPRESFGLGSYELYRFEFVNSWADAHADDPFAFGWHEGKVLRVEPLGVFDGDGNEIEKLDNDDDGRIDEDFHGGVDLNRNYDSHWDEGFDNPASGNYSGPAPFSESETQAVRDFINSYPNILTATTFHSGDDMLLYPWGYSSTAVLPDWLWFGRLGRKGSQLTEVGDFQGAPHLWTARGLYSGSGSAMDWLYEQGILAWTAEVYRGDSRADFERLGMSDNYLVKFSPGTLFNPPPNEISESVQRWLNWNLYLLTATPNVGVSDVDIESGMLLATIYNDGLIPLDVMVEFESGEGEAGGKINGLSAEERTVSIPIPGDVLPQMGLLTVDAWSQIVLEKGWHEEESLPVEITESGVRFLEGTTETFAELGDYFGGWYADTTWEERPYRFRWVK